MADDPGKAEPGCGGEAGGTATVRDPVSKSWVDTSLSLSGDLITWMSSVPTGGVLAQGFETLTLVAATGLQKKLPGGQESPEREEGHGVLGNRLPQLPVGSGGPRRHRQHGHPRCPRSRSGPFAGPCLPPSLLKAAAPCARPTSAGSPCRRPHPAWEEVARTGAPMCELGTQSGGRDISRLLSQSGVATVPSRLWLHLCGDRAWGTFQELCVETPSTARGCLPSASSARRASGLRGAPRAWPSTEHPAG